MDILKKEFIYLDFKVTSKKELLEKISQISFENKLASSAETVYKGFVDREELDSTAFEDGFAIPHARTKDILKAGAFFVRNDKPIIWDKDGKLVDCLILIVIPEGQGDYLDILSGIATKLMSDEVRNTLKISNDLNKIHSLLTKKEKQKESVVSTSKNAIKIVGVTACATGVVHTYMARDAILTAAKKLNWIASIETQGQKGQEFKLKQEDIDNADAVILAVDIAIDLDRFAGKKIYKVGTKTLINDPETEVRYAVSKGKIISKESVESGGAFEIKNGKAWIQHIMSGISYMIPFIVFAGMVFATVTGIGKIVYGSWLGYGGSIAYDGGVHYIDNVNLGHATVKGGAFIVSTGADGMSKIRINGSLIAFLYYLNSFANLGFGVMIPVMGAYIANSIAGRSAITPAFVVTSLATNPKGWYTWGSFNGDVYSPLDKVYKPMSEMFPSNGGGIFAALLFGFVIGHTVKWINTRWRIHKNIKPIMPIIIIPVFVSLFYGTLTILLIGNVFGYLVGYVNIGLQQLEDSSVGMAFLGLILGLIAGVDMGGPINKIASFGATALILTDGGKAMGCAAAAFPIAPMGAGIATQIFRRKFKDDQALGINATILGFMGISEGAIPFAAKYTWAAFVPNILCSGVAGMLAGLFHVSGWVGAWGGPIIALFGGVTTWSMSYIGIVWYLLAIAIGVILHSFLFRFLVSIQQDTGRIGSVKSIHTSFKLAKNKDKIKLIEKFKSEIYALSDERYKKVKEAKLNGDNTSSIKSEFDKNINAKKSELKSELSKLNNIMKTENKHYKTLLKKEKVLISQNKEVINNFKKQNHLEHKNEVAELKTQLKQVSVNSNKKMKSEQRLDIKNQINNNIDEHRIKYEEEVAKYTKEVYNQFSKLAII